MRRINYIETLVYTAYLKAIACYFVDIKNKFLMSGSSYKHNASNHG